LARFWKIRASLWFSEKPSGSLSGTSAMALSFSYETPVSTASNEYSGVRFDHGPEA